MVEGDIEKEGIKIVDKRRFTTSGDTRADVEEVTRRPESAVKAVERSPQSSSNAPANDPRGSTKHNQPSASTVNNDRANLAHGNDVDFSSFVVSLATQALVMLGEIPNPETQLTAVNIDAAKQTIEILTMIEKKTTGNLTVEEEKLIKDVLTSLRMEFVRRAGL